jgi:hypothetical protein
MSYPGPVQVFAGVDIDDGPWDLAIVALAALSDYTYASNALLGLHGCTIHSVCFLGAVTPARRYIAHGCDTPDGIVASQ